MLKGHILSKPRILVYDIEITPSLGYVWGKWKQNVIEFDQEWYMMSFAYKWLDERKTHVHALPDYKTYKKDPEDDSELVRALWELFNEADVVIAHNGDKFDQKKSNARFITHGLTPPSPYRTVDTLKVARKYFGFNSNRLDDLGNYFEVGRKMQHEGFELWKKCMQGNMAAWKKMKRYNKQDVRLLQQVYERMLPWIDNHPSLNLMSGNLDKCPKCGDGELVKDGIRYNKSTVMQEYKCKQCGGYSRSRVSDSTAGKPLAVN